MPLLLQFGPAFSVVNRGLRKFLDTGRRVHEVFSGPDIGSQEYHQERGFNKDGSVYDPSHNAVPDSIVNDAKNEQTPDVVYDPYTESILAEMMSSQQIESKRESAPRFIRPKKKKKIIYK